MPPAPDPPASGHVPVLSDAVLDRLAPQPGDTVIDATVGRGGHAEMLAAAIGPTGTLIGFDLDPANVAFAQTRLADAPATIEIIHGSFAAAATRLRRTGQVADVVLADLGFSSSQMDDPTRGLSFRGDGPLDMRLDPTATRTAADLLATATQAEIADIIYHFGEEPLARKIARKLVEARERGPIQSTSELTRIVLAAYGPRARSSRVHPATRTFMALRIAVNSELEALETLLHDVEDGARRAGRGGWLASGARVGIISFHSLEDRLVKRAFVSLDTRGLGQRITRKPVIADDAEIRDNPRARSAKLRVLRILGLPAPPASPAPDDTTPASQDG